MKWFIIITTVLLLFLFAQYMIARSSDKTEQQKYTVLHAEGAVEIRHYPKALVASVESPATGLRDNSSGNFRRLAGYIFGGNSKNQSIAMTAPVRMEKTASGNKMTFVMPEGMSIDEMPAPKDSGILLSQSDDETLAVIRFTGFASEKEIAEKTEELQKWLIKNNIKAVSDFKYLGYNPPYQVTHRRNEVAVKVDWSKNNE